MNIPRLILRKLRTEHRGKDNAIKGADLLSWLYEQGAKVKEREMRDVLATLEKVISWCGGYFIADENDEEKAGKEVKYVEDYYRKYSMSMSAKMRKLRKDYPRFFHEEPEQRQPDLPFGDA